ncbi:MAG TPA: NADH-quinone oxidoreductase subunit G, partial [Gordonia polyisoprenivorans]|nr:NADH-quinone oxidoreductase subunit G [Gordonia polyisoprenivorans]
PGPGEAVLSTWHLLLDDGRLQDGEPYLAGTAHPSVARCSAATASAAGLTDGHDVELSTDSGTLTLPLLITDMVDGVVWVPTYSVSSHVRSQLHAESGDVVAVRPAEGQS